MGREIFTQIRDKDGKVLWDSAEDAGDFFCGRNEATNVIAYRVQNWDNPIVDFTDLQERQYINEALAEVQDKSDRLFDHIESRIQDAHAARRCAPSVEVFEDFTALITDLEQARDEEDWNLADELKRLMSRTINTAIDIGRPGAYNPKEPDIASLGLRVVWVVSE